MSDLAALLVGLGLFWVEGRAVASDGARDSLAAVRHDAIVDRKAQ